MHISLSPASPRQAMPDAVTGGRVGLVAGDAAPSTTPFTGGRRNEYALGDIARALAIRHLTVKTIIAQLRTLAVDCSMPLPKSPRLYGGRIVTGPQSIHKHSRWDAELFDAWVESRAHDAAPSLATGPTEHLRAEMQRRAWGVIEGGRK